MVVFDRKEPFQKVLKTCQGKLNIRKKVKGAALLEGDEVSRPAVWYKMRAALLDATLRDNRNLFFAPAYMCKVL